MKALMKAQRHNVLTALETGLISVRSLIAFSFARSSYKYDWSINSKPECGLPALIGKLNRIVSGGLYFRYKREMAFSPGT